MSSENSAVDMAQGLAGEVRQLQIQVLEERLIGLKAQEKLAQVLIEQTEKQLQHLKEG